MRMLEDNETPTIEMIKEDLKINPPGQGILHAQIDFLYNAPFYLRYLLDRLEKSEQPAATVRKKRKKKQA